MKAVLIIAGSFIWSLLFFKQDIGLNVFLFSILIMGGLLLIRKENLKPGRNLIFVAGLISSGFFVFYYGAAFPMVMFVLSVFFISTIHYSEKISLISRPFIIFISTLEFWLVIWVLKLEAQNMEKKEKTKEFENVMRYIFWIFFSLIIIVLFFVLYQDSNELFYQLTSNIHIDISTAYLGFTLFGIFILNQIFNTNYFGFWSDYELKLPDEHQNGNSIADSFIKNKNVILTVLLGVLNVLILFINGIDFSYLTGIISLPENINHSQMVHQAIGSLIFSVVVAMILILVIYSGKQNLDMISKNMLRLTYLWIIQNIFLVFTAFSKNYEYISLHDLTYKRIGVMVYLLLTLIGLVIVFIKVRNKKSNWYVFRKTSFSFYLVLLGLSVFNWPVIVTKYNLNSALEKGKIDDAMYLIELDDRNNYLLNEFSDAHPEYFSTLENYYIYEKIDVFKNRTNTWQSFTISDYLVRSKID